MLDGAGNTTGLMDGQGNMAARYMYSAFGKLTGRWGPMADMNVMQFSSMPRHANSGLSLYPFRAYDPSVQRWVSQDPLGEAGGINPYQFVWNDPLGWVDAEGAQPTLIARPSLPTGPRQLEFDLELREARPIRWGPGRMPEEEVVRAREYLLRRGAPSDMALSRARPEPASGGTLLSRLVNALRDLFKKCPPAKGANQSELDFGQSLPWLSGESGLVIGRNADLSAPGALGPGEYRLNWFDGRDVLGEQANLAVNRWMIQDVLRLNFPIRDATPLSYARSPYLNLERQSAQSLGWTYQDGRWVPPPRQE